MSSYSGPYKRLSEMLDRIADAITKTDELRTPTGSRALDSLERLAIWFEAHGGIPHSDDESHAVLYKTKAEWDSQRDLISEKGTIYIYGDYTETVDEEGNTVFIPALKVGDGLAYLIDLPVANPALNDALIENIAERVAEILSDQVAANVIGSIRDNLNETKSLVTPEDRTKWDGKVSSTLDEEDPENLILF